jgi:hypothetical protein
VVLSEDAVRERIETLAAPDAKEKDSNAVFPMTYVSREILAVALDYWKLLNKEGR